MVSLSNHEVRQVEGRCHDLILRQAQDEVYWGTRQRYFDLVLPPSAPPVAGPVSRARLSAASS